MMHDLIMKVRAEGHIPDFTVIAESGPAYGHAEGWYVSPQHGYLVEFSNAAMTWHKWLNYLPSELRELLRCGYRSSVDLLLETAYLYGPHAVPKYDGHGQAVLLATTGKAHEVISGTNQEPILFDNASQAANWVRRAKTGRAYRLVNI